MRGYGLIFTDGDLLGVPERRRRMEVELEWVLMSPSMRQTSVRNAVRLHEMVLGCCAVLVHTVTVKIYKNIYILDE